MINLAASYAATEKLRLMSQVEYVRAENYFLPPPPPPTATTPYTDLPGYSAVINDLYRLTAGFDYLIRPRIDVFVRYNFYDVIDTQAIQQWHRPHVPGRSVRYVLERAFGARPFPKALRITPRGLGRCVTVSVVLEQAGRLLDSGGQRSR